MWRCYFCSFFLDDSIRHINFYPSVVLGPAIRKVKNVNLVSSMSSACPVTVPPFRSYVEELHSGL